jgi:hypothetical protein
MDDIPVAFANDPSVAKAFTHVFGGGAKFEPTTMRSPTVDASAFDAMRAAMCIMVTYLRADAAELKQRAVIPARVPTQWAECLISGNLIPGTAIPELQPDTGDAYTQRIGTLATIFNALDVETVPTHANIVSRLHQKVILQYTKLTAARELLRLSTDVP